MAGPGSRPIAPLVVVTGTGTGIGKTHLTAALATLARSHRGATVGAWKPVESGVGAGPTDHDVLLEASSFHVKQFLGLAHGLAEPVSPHLAARLEGVTIDLAPIVARTADLRTRVDLLLLELPGGLFTPLTESALNIDLVHALEPTETLLVAPNRLGVLHDVLAATRAAAFPMTAVALTTLGPGDASAATNAAELRRLLGIPVLEIPNRPVLELATEAPLAELLARCWKPVTPR
jgi:dethiobiotin synthetase